MKENELKCPSCRTKIELDFSNHHIRWDWDCPGCELSAGSWKYEVDAIEFLTSIQRKEDDTEYEKEQQRLAINYFECYPDYLDQLCENELPLGIQLRKNGHFLQAVKSGLQFEVLTTFDLLRAPVWKLMPEDATDKDFDLLKVYRVHRTTY